MELGDLARQPQLTNPAPPPNPTALADREFTLEVRKGLLIIMRAVMRRYHMGWADFLPRGMVVSDGESGVS